MLCSLTACNACSIRAEESVIAWSASDVVVIRTLSGGTLDASGVTLVASRIRNFTDAELATRAKRTTDTARLGGEFF